MKRRAITIFVIIIICVFVASLGLLFFQLRSDNLHGKEVADQRFSQLASDTASACGIYAYDSPEFIAAFNNLVGSPELFNTIELKSDGKVVYSYPAEPRKSSSIFVIPHESNITDAQNNKISLKATLYTLTSYDIYKRTKVTFLVILCATLVAALLIIYINLSESKEDSKEIKPKKEEDDDFDFGFEDDDFEEFPAEPVESKDTSFSEDSIIPNEISIENVDVDNTNNEIPNIIEEESKPETLDFEPITPQLDVKSDIEEPIKVEEEVKEVVEKPVENTSMFSPDTGLGWESYLPTRLESELIRAGSSEQDLSLFIFRVKDLEHTSEISVKISKLLLEVFQFKDMLFEYKKDGFAAIMVGKDIDTALKIAEDIYSNICDVLKENNVNAILASGISSRSLRLISGERLLLEAEQALSHALEDEKTPIVAFRVNPEKYREYMRASVK